MTAPHREIIGTWQGVTLDIVAWDAVGAQVGLSCAGMFTREVGSAPLAGGLQHLDTALDGRLRTLRSAGLFSGALAETILLDRPPSTIASPAVLLVGLGDPDDWTAAVMERATCVAVRMALGRGVTSAGIAPGMLDSGLLPEQIVGATEAMLRGVVNGLDSARRLVETGLSDRLRLERWSFGTGAAHLDAAARAFRTAFANMD